MPEEDNRRDPEPDAGTFDLRDTLSLLDPREMHIERTEGEGLTLRSPEHGEVQGVTIEPCFPITEFGKYLLLRHADGAEMGMLEDMRDLDDDSMQAVETELKQQHFVPIITKVYSISREFHLPVWEVETDRGPRRLELKRRGDVHRLRGGRIYIRDAGGGGYLIPDLSKLDPVSRSLVETNT